MEGSPYSVRIRNRISLCLITYLLIIILETQGNQLPITVKRQATNENAHASNIFDLSKDFESPMYKKNDYMPYVGRLGKRNLKIELSGLNSKSRSADGLISKRQLDSYNKFGRLDKLLDQQRLVDTLTKRDPMQFVGRLGKRDSNSSFKNLWKRDYLQFAGRLGKRDAMQFVGRLGKRDPYQFVGRLGKRDPYQFVRRVAQPDPYQFAGRIGKK